MLRSVLLRSFAVLGLVLMLLTACRSAIPAPSTAPPAANTAEATPSERAASLLAEMTLAEKIGQMTQVEKNSITPDEVGAYSIGSVLSGGSGYPPNNTPAGWRRMVNAYQQAALSTRLRIPILYGVDAVHGHGAARGATIFPHNIGLGAANDPGLVQRIGRATAEEMAATDVHWNFAPVAAVPQDIRWGRTYEGYGEDTALVAELGAAYVQGLQESSPAILATPKHFLADGGTTWDTASATNLNHPYRLDQGDARIDEATLRAVHLPPYRAVIAAGARSIMVSFSSWNGVKMHAHKYLLTDVLKGELGFSGFLVSDWQGIDQLPGDYYSNVVASINAGVDMVMVPYDFRTFVATLSKAIQQGDVPMSRIDDAVGRILSVKFELGLFDAALTDASNQAVFGSDAHRQLAREAVRKSLVLLQNEGRALPLAKDAPLIFVAGQHADDIGLQAGGWTIDWQGKAGEITPGTTILDGIKAAVGRQTGVHYDRFGRFDTSRDASGQPAIADVGIAVIGEQPYAEGVGDAPDLTLPDGDLALLARLRQRSRKLVVVLISGRPLIISEQLPLAEAWVAAWLPGTEGGGVADVLFGDYPFVGRLPYTWPRSMAQLPFDFDALPASGPDAPLFPAGFGLTTTGD